MEFFVLFETNLKKKENFCRCCFHKDNKIGFYLKL